MGDANPIRTLGDYSKPSHECYRNTIELPIGNNMVPLRSDTIWIHHHIGGSYYSFPCSILSTGKDRKTPQRYRDVPTTSKMISLRSMDSCPEYIQPPPHRARTSSPMLDGSSHCSDATYSSKQITSSCEIYSGPHDTQYCIENPEQAFVEYASSRTDKAGELVSNFMASQDARLSKFEANFKQQQSEMTNKIDMVLKAITDQMAGALPSDTVTNPKLDVNSTSLVLSARSYPTEDPQCSTQIYGSINAITIHQEQRGTPQLELKDPHDIEKIGPRRNDKEREIEWLDVEDVIDMPRAIVGDTSRIKSYIPKVSAIPGFSPVLA
ncbi:hypothetical protein Tco_1314089 [Tanacetum coccineum]